MQEQYANIIVDITSEKLDKIFQYQIPQELCKDIVPGIAVEIPFGRGNRLIRGYVIAVTDTPDYPQEKMKAINRCLSNENGIEERLLKLAVWMQENYGSTLIQALKTVLPVKQKVKEKKRRRLSLIISQAEATRLLLEYQRKHYKAKVRLLEALIVQEEIPYEFASSKLNINPQVVKSFEEQGILCVRETQVYRNPLSGQESTNWSITLNPQQKNAVDGVQKDLQNGMKKVYLLHGITGSGKTEVYISLISKEVLKGRQAIVLIPEIALTYQTVMRFYKCFGDRVSVLNSKMSKGERYDQYMRAKNGELDVMIGPRSALFTPFPALGCIIIDEEHEGSYKSEHSPRYHARETAVKRAQMEGAYVVLGSATPSLESYYRAEQGEYKLIELTERAKESILPKVYTVDLRRELKDGNRSIISRQLYEMMNVCLEKKEQIMLFLNRRGYESFLSCRSCGEVLKCPHCDVSLTSHRDGRLLCHYCGYETKPVKSCPHCGSQFISGFKVGTQQIEEVVQKAFPESRILRMDLDSTRKKGGYEEILEAFSNHEADILVGTQMIVKGHDFENVTLVGVLAADVSLNASDYRAGERTFQLLTQAAGRAGRGEKKGAAVIQTYNPQHYSIAAAVRQDYRQFYKQEIAYRKLMSYPPASQLLAVHCQSPDYELLEMAAGYLKQYIIKIDTKKELQVIGPADPAISKVNDIYRKVLYLKHMDYRILVVIKNRMEKYIEVNRGYENVVISFDFNPMN